MGSITVHVRSLVWFSAGAVATLLSVVLLTTAWSVDAAPEAPGAGTESTFVPVSPCRLADTRSGTDRVGDVATLGPASISTFGAVGTVGQCKVIPQGAISVSLNVTALNATEQTFLTFWPEGERPTVASLNPAPGEPPTPNAVVVGLSASGTFDVYNDLGSVDIVMDINGYYTADGLEATSNRLGSLPIGAFTPGIGHLLCTEWSAAYRCLDVSDEATAAYLAGVSYDVDTKNFPNGTRFRLKVGVSGSEPATSCFRLWAYSTKSVVADSEFCVDNAANIQIGLWAGTGISQPIDLPTGRDQYIIQARTSVPGRISTDGNVLLAES